MEDTECRPPDPGGHKTDETSLKYPPKNRNDVYEFYGKNVSKNDHCLQNKEAPVSDTASRIKRQRPSSPPQSEQNEFKPQIRFLVVKKLNGDSMSVVSPFLIDKLLTSVAGSVKAARKLRDGSLLVETFNQEQTDKLITHLPTNRHLDVTVEPHKALNSVKGVFTCYDIDSVPIDELLANLRQQGVQEIVRINRRINEVQTPTHTYIARFGLADLPAKLKVGYLSVPVRPYFPLPLKCHQCHRFNHLKLKCTREPICAHCGDPVHENPCTTAKCVNCGGRHSAADRNCPRWILEKKIIEVKTTEKISYGDAKAKVKLSQPLLFSKSYSSVLIEQKCPEKPPVCSCRNQTASENNLIAPSTSSATHGKPLSETSVTIKQPTSKSKPPLDNRDPREQTEKVTDSPTQKKAQRGLQINSQAEREMLWRNDWDSDDSSSLSSTKVDNTDNLKLKKHKPKKKNNYNKR